MALVFVYGTLLAGEPNHRLLDGCPCAGAAVTEPVFRMLGLGGFPGIVPGGRTAIRGEVYLVDGPVLEALDRLEGAPTFYRRERMKVTIGKVRAEVEGYVLAHVPARARLEEIASGDWRARYSEATPIDEVA